jgi:hypothetical protein
MELAAGLRFKIVKIEIAAKAKQGSRLAHTPWPKRTAKLPSLAELSSKYTVFRTVPVP